MPSMRSWHTISAIPGRTATVGELISKLVGVTDVYSPVRLVNRNGRSWSVPWLGTLILSRWDGADPHLWYDVRNSDGVSAILGGWPPWGIAEAEVERFRARIDELSSGAVADVAAPCSVGDEVQFTYLSFYQVRARCLWAGSGVVGVRIRMLGHDHMIQVPYQFVEVVASVERARFLGRRQR